MKNNHKSINFQKYTEQQINDYTAKEIMGWICHGSRFTKHSLYEDVENNKWIPHWNPCKNIEQSWKCLEIIMSKGLLHTISLNIETKIPEPSDSCFSIQYNIEFDKFNKWGKSISELITLACCEAIKLKNNGIKENKNGIRSRN